MGGFQQQYPGAYAGGSPEDDYSGYGQQPIDPSQIPPPPQVQSQGPAPDYLGLPWRRKKIPAVPQLAGNPMVSDAQGITGQGPLMAPGPQAQAQPQPQAPSMSTPAPAQLASTNIQQAPLPQQPRLAPGVQGQPPVQPPPPAQMDPLTARLSSLAMQSLPQNAILPPKPPTGARAVIGGLLGAKHPALGQLVEYGPKGMAQMQQYAQYQQMLPEAQKVAALANLERNRMSAQSETDRLRTEQERKDRAEEQQKQSDAFDKQANAITINLHGREVMDPSTQPVAPNYTRRTLTHPLTQEARTFDIPTPDEYIRQKYLDETEPTPKYIKDKLGADVPDRLKPAVLESFAKLVQSGEEGEANRLMRQAMADQNLEASKWRTEYGRQTQLMVAAMREAASKPDDAAINSYVDQMMDNPDVFQGIKDTKLKDAVGQAWRVRTGLPAPAKLNTGMGDVEGYSRRSLENIDAVKQLLNDPMVMKRLGPVLGRIGNAEQDVGATANLSPADAQKVQKLRSSLTYLFLGEGKQLFGGRPPQQLMEKLSSVSPRASETLPLLSGALDAVETNAYGNITAAEKQRFGGKTRPGFNARPGGAQQPQKTATSAHIAQYAAQKKITVQQATKEFTDSGYTITQ